MAEVPRRLLRFSIRSLLIGTAIIAVATSFFGVRSLHALRDRQAATVIQQLGGRYDYANQDVVHDLPWFSRCMLFVLNEEPYRITHVSLDATNVTDDELSQIASLSHLQGIDISRTSITESGVAQLATSESLQYINVHNTNLTGQFVNDLRRRRPALVVDWEAPRNATKP